MEYPHLPEHARNKIASLREAAAADQRIVTETATVCKMLGVQQTRVRDLLDDGTLGSLLDGRLGRIFVADVYRYLITRIVGSHGEDGSPLKPSPFLGVRPHEKRGKAAAGGAR